MNSLSPPNSPPPAADLEHEHTGAVTFDVNTDPDFQGTNPDGAHVHGTAPSDDRDMNRTDDNPNDFNPGPDHGCD